MSEKELNSYRFSPEQEPADEMLEQIMREVAEEAKASNRKATERYLEAMRRHSDIQEITNKIVKFTTDRDWDQFHNGKDLALALSIEAAELNELYLWKKPEDVDVEKVKEELADILNYAFLIADKYNLDIRQIILDKLEHNAQKYPVDKSKGNSKKYNEL